MNPRRNIGIMAETRSIPEWITRGYLIAKENNFTPKEKAEFIKYFRLVAEADMELFGTSYDLSSIERWM